MKILVISDTHGKLDKVRDIWGKLKGIDLIAHAGDYYSDGKILEKEFHVPVVAVHGNCDRDKTADFEKIPTEYGDILLIHGHKLNVKRSLEDLKAFARKQKCRAVIYGHTHMASVREEDGIYFINPGSLSRPRDESGGTYGIVRTKENRLDASIVYYNTLFRRIKKSGGTGFIKNILNYSDRL